MNRFGKRSLKEIATCHEDIRRVLNLAIKRSNVDFGVHQGARTVAQQQEYFNNGKSRINPMNYSTNEDLAVVAHHITIPFNDAYKLSRAFDIHISEVYERESLAWDEKHLCYVAGVIISCAKELYEENEIEHLIQWGGDWDQDGEIMVDQGFDDLPHFQIYKPLK